MMTDHTPSCCAPKPKRDWFLISSVSTILLALVVFFSGVSIPYLDEFGHHVAEFLHMMWWGIVLGILAVGIMNQIPREFFIAMMGNGDSFGGIIRAAIAGTVLDVCSHGVLMIGAKLYERGISLAQLFTFLIATPWNSITMTLIMIALIGLKWTLLFIACSVVVAIITGVIVQFLVGRGVLPPNPHKSDLPADFRFWPEAKARLKQFRPDRTYAKNIVKEGFVEGRMVLRWLMFGIVLAAAIRTFVPPEMFGTLFGPTMAGLGLTLLAATIIEVCTEGSTPLAADIVTRAQAPGNGFIFLMAGVATDYTEIMILRELTKRWLIAFTLPIITVPQILLIGWMMNVF